MEGARGTPSPSPPSLPRRHGEQSSERGSGQRRQHPCFIYLHPPLPSKGERPGTAGTATGHSKPPAPLPNAPRNTKAGQWCGKAARHPPGPPKPHGDGEKGASLLLSRGGLRGKQV